jgi:hypothetical protein
MSTNSNPTPWPISVARTTGTQCSALLQSLLATSTFDEISNADDYASVHRYVKSQGRADNSGNTTLGLVFWVYPTGLYGPYHETEDHKIKQHGLLLTVEPGVSVEEVVKRARAGLEDDVIVHEHVGAS